MALDLETKALVCRTIGGRHELWGLTATREGHRYHTYMGTVTDPAMFGNRVVIDEQEETPTEV